MTPIISTTDIIMTQNVMNKYFLIVFHYNKLTILRLQTLTNINKNMTPIISTTDNINHTQNATNKYFFNPIINCIPL
jgi:hypothetical protein